MRYGTISGTHSFDTTSEGKSFRIEVTTKGHVYLRIGPAGSYYHQDFQVGDLTDLEMLAHQMLNFVVLARLREGHADERIKTLTDILHRQQRALTDAGLTVDSLLDVLVEMET